MQRPLMLVDADCGFCARVAERVPALGVRVDRASVQATDLAALGIDGDRALREMPVVRTDGSIAWGHRAWAAILQTGPAPVRAVGLMLGSRALDRLGRRGYALVADHRHRLPGGSPACDPRARQGGDAVPARPGPRR